MIGSVIPLSQSIHSNSSGSVSDNTYIVFIVLTALGFVLSMAICDADKILRRDGSKILVMQHPTWKSELLGLFKVLRTDVYIVALFPMFLASNWFYTYQFNVCVLFCPPFVCPSSNPPFLGLQSGSFRRTNAIS